jgi:hypothetical protein
MTRKELNQHKIFCKILRTFRVIIITAPDHGDEANGYFNDEQTEEILHLKKGTLDKWREQKKGPEYTEIDSGIRYHLCDILYFFKLKNNLH